MVSICKYVNRVTNKKAIEVCGILDKILRDVSIDIYPDVFCENLGLPTGITISMPKENACWLPTFHRDAGCGFLIFSISGCTDMSKLYNLLLECGLHEMTGIFQPDCNFLQFLGKIDLFDAEKEELKSEYGKFSNTLEVRQLENTQELIAFFHTGSDVFKNILQNRFDLEIKKYCLENGDFPPEAIENGIYGVPINIELGRAYRKYMDYAIKYAKLSRQKTYQIIKEKLIANDIAVDFLNDTIHCGYVETSETITLFRGVQYISNNKTNIIAGHRETNALLVTKKTHQFIPHGISWYADSIVDGEFYDEIKRAKQIFANSEINYKVIPSYTLSINLMKEMYETARFLYPIINIQGYKRQSYEKRTQPTPVTCKSTIDGYKIEYRGLTRFGLNPKFAVIVVSNKIFPIEKTDSLCNSIINKYETSFDLFVINDDPDIDNLSRYCTFHFSAGFPKEKVLSYGISLANIWGNKNYEFYLFVTEEY